MKRKAKKILCIFLLLLTLFNFTYASKTYATEIGDVVETAGEGLKQTGDYIWDSLTDGVGGIFDGVTGILTSPLRGMAVVLGGIARGIASSVGNIGAEEKAEKAVFLSIEDILFHNVNDKVPIININFFETAKPEVIRDIRTNVATWYYVIRNLAIIISLLVLIYIGIRMAISTLAEDKAKYKSMLKDWIVGFITIFLLHYIIIATIYTNEALVKAIYPKGNSGFMNDYIDKIFGIAINPLSSFFRGTAATIVYVFMTTMIFGFLFTYIKRMLTIAFLIIIAPIITVTYSIDKIGDRKISSIKYLAKRIYI